MLKFALTFFVVFVCAKLTWAQQSDAMRWLRSTPITRFEYGVADMRRSINDRAQAHWPAEVGRLNHVDVVWRLQNQQLVVQANVSQPDPQSLSFERCRTIINEVQDLLLGKHLTSLWDTVPSYPWGHFRFGSDDDLPPVRMPRNLDDEIARLITVSAYIHISGQSAVCFKDLVATDITYRRNTR
jgi:hypothetical protein